MTNEARSSVFGIAWHRGGVLGLVLTSALASGCGRLGYTNLAALGQGDGGLDAASDAGALDASTADAGMDASSSLCALGECRRVFVTSTVPPTAAVGGLAAADAFCQAAADAHALGGTWKAWLSDDTTAASARLSHAAVPYRLLDGTLVANDWADLVDGTLAHAIDHTESGAPATGSSEVWTGTYADGTSSASSCASWTNGTASTPYADVGILSAVDGTWSSVYLQFCDRSDVRFYCFEQ